MKRMIALLLIFLLGFSALAESGAGAGFAYEHDPRDNPNAMRDIVINPDAVYGFSPNPDSTRLGDYADAIDWTDPDQVAEARALRQAYHDSLSELYRMIEDMLLEGKDVETIARAVSQRRNELRLEAEADDSEALALTKQSNLETYGDEMGPSADYLYEKYGSWQTVLEKALGTNAGMDACLGFYDEYYDLYDIEPVAEADDAADEPETDSDDDPFSLWNPDAPALSALVGYVEAVTDPDSPDFIPIEDRIAVFDLDGTLMCETYPFCFEYMVFADYALNHADELPEDVLAVAREIVDATGSAKPSGMSARQAAAAAIAYKGMTMAELAAVVEEFKASEAWGFTGMTRGEAWYRPMLELVNVLQRNDFTIYIVTATERNIVRQVVAGTLDIPPSHVIGTEYGYVATNQGDAADTDYTFQSNDKIVFDGSYCGENAKTSKVDAIVREIGQQPVLAFGNSSGDLAMEVYTISDNPYRSAAYMVLADDDVREWGDPESAAEKKASYEEMGIGTISMRDDFKTIYGDGVTKAEVPQDGGKNALDAIRARGVLRVGTAGDYQPMSYLDPETNAYVGFDAALAEDLAASLGVELEYVETSWPTLMEDTLNGKFDLAICGITITDARKEQALMSDGYLENGKTVLCRAEDADKYTSLAAINRPEVRVMENPGGLNEKFARENLPDATLIIHDVNQEIPGLVASGEADVMITEIMEAGYYVGQDSRLAAPLIYEPFTYGQLGVLMPKGSEDLLDYVNDFLEDEKSSGRIDALAEEYIYRYIDAELDDAA